MVRRVGRRRGTKPLINDELVEAMLADLRGGRPPKIVCAKHGVNLHTFYTWRHRGYLALERRENGGVLDEVEQQYARLVERIEKASAEAADFGITLIQKAAEGGMVIGRKTRRYRGPDGKIVEEVEETVAPPQPKAAMWLLERRFPDEFGGKASQVQISGPDGGPLQVASVDTAALASRIVSRLTRDDDVDEIEAPRPALESGEVYEAEIITD